MSKIPKEELKAKDPFLKVGDRALQVIEDKWPAILGAGLIFVVIGAVFVGYQKWTTHNEGKVQDSIYSWMSQIEAKQKADQATPDKKLDYEAAYGSLVSNLEAEITKNKSTTAAQTSAMKLADFLLANDKAEQAAALLTNLESSVDKGSWVYGLFQVQLASLLSQAGKPQEAFNQLEKVTQAKSSNYLHPEAFLKMAVLQEEMGNLDRAKEIYNRVSVEYGDTDTGRSAQALLRLMDIRSQQGSSK